MNSEEWNSADKPPAEPVRYPGLVLELSTGETMVGGWDGEEFTGFIRVVDLTAEGCPPVVRCVRWKVTDPDATLRTKSLLASLPRMEDPSPGGIAYWPEAIVGERVHYFCTDPEVFVFPSFRLEELHEMSVPELEDRLRAQIARFRAANVPREEGHG